MEKKAPGIDEKAVVCPCCKRTFSCGLEAGHAECWCVDLPPMLPPAPDRKSCYCPDCLRSLAASQPR